MLVAWAHAVEVLFIEGFCSVKQAVPIRDPVILSKIHQTYRIGYIKVSVMSYLSLRCVEIGNTVGGDFIRPSYWWRFEGAGAPLQVTRPRATAVLGNFETVVDKSLTTNDEKHNKFNMCRFHSFLSCSLL